MGKKPSVKLLPGETSSDEMLSWSPSVIVETPLAGLVNKLVHRIVFFLVKPGEYILYQTKTIQAFKKVKRQSQTPLRS